MRLFFIGLTTNTVNKYHIWDKQHHIRYFGGKTYHILVVYFINYRWHSIFYIQCNLIQSIAIFSEASYQASPFIKNPKKKYGIYYILHLQYHAYYVQAKQLRFIYILSHSIALYHSLLVHSL